MAPQLAQIIFIYIFTRQNNEYQVYFMLEILAFLSENSSDKISSQMNKFVSALSEDTLSNPAIFYPELLTRIIKKGIWQIPECDESMELLLSRKNSLLNVVDCIVKVVRTLVLEETILTA